LNFPDAEKCKRCKSDLRETTFGKSQFKKKSPGYLKRAIILILVLLASVAGFYLSLIATSDALAYDDKKRAQIAVRILHSKGFAKEAFLFDTVVVFRGSDNWLNVSVPKENAYASTNFPFEIVTIYPEFFARATDDTERAAILLHEAQHLQGKDEKQAYEFVWKNRAKLGWTKDRYGDSQVWRDVRNQTKEYFPNLFVCDWIEFNDCTEQPSV